jgi:crotonobetainyl-CoA:carnitine CoA-transferase CaiB-like acyl-CoA transferase
MSGLLEGLKVVEVASFVFVPAAGTVLSDFGADVVHVEPPGIGDPYRMLTSLSPLPECEENYCWLLDSRNKKSMVLDLKRDEGLAVLLDMVRDADIFITNYHPSVLADLRITYEELSPENPRLIYAHGTGYGEIGNETEKPGYDATAWWARSGLMDAVRPGGAELALATPAMGDHPSAMSVFAGISLALYARERTGKGTKVSTSLMANGAWSNSILVQAALSGGTTYVPPSQASAANAMVNHYRSSDGGSFFLVLVKEAQEFEQFCRAIERPELAKDPRFEAINDRRANAGELAGILQEWFGQRSLEEWRSILDAHSITFGIIASTDEVVADPQMRENGVFVEMAGRPGTEVVNSPIELRDFPKKQPTPPPELGEHSVSVLKDLGYDDTRIAKLREAGVISSG